MVSNNITISNGGGHFLKYVPKTSYRPKAQILLAFGLLLSVSCLGQDSSYYYTLSVPVDYFTASAGKTIIAYELGAPFSRHKPTVFIIADAQQFYVRKEAVAALQSSLFDSTVNVVGIIGRNNNSDLKRSVADKKGAIDWAKAYQIFSWSQYINDINQVRKRLLGDTGHICLYGQSGGGYLVHQFLSEYGQYVDKAFTGAALNYQLDATSGINHDRFWEEVTTDTAMARSFEILLKKNGIDRPLIGMLFQRQHFFAKQDSLPFERQQLLNVLLADNKDAINSYKQRYQIDAIQQFYSGIDGIPIKIRLFEFIFPLLERFQVKPGALQPDMENLYFSSLELVNLYKQASIFPREMGFLKQHTLATQVFILAGRWDHTADYRSQIALAACYPHNVLFIADDNHTFSKLKEGNLYGELIMKFMKGDIPSTKQFNSLSDYKKYRWIE